MLTLSNSFTCQLVFNNTMNKKCGVMLMHQQKTNTTVVCTIFYLSKRLASVK